MNPVVLKAVIPLFLLEKWGFIWEIKTDQEYFNDFIALRRDIRVKTLKSTSRVVLTCC